MSKIRRTKKLIDPALQFKFAVAFATTAGIAVVVQSIMLVYSLSNLATAIPKERQRILDYIPGILGTNLLITFAILIPLTVSVGVLMSFRVCGPLYNMRNFLRRIANGEEPGQCRIRDNDELHDFCDTLNEAVGALQAKAASPSTDAGPEEAETQAA